STVGNAFASFAAAGVPPQRPLREGSASVKSADLLVDAFGRVSDAVQAALGGLTPEELAYRIDPDANTVAWLIWHLTRIQDDHVADVMGVEQLWTSDGWYERFDVPFDPSATGFGHASDEVAAVRPRDGSLLLDYYDAVHERTIGYVRTLTDRALDRVVDSSWDPPVTLGVRLVSVLSDDLEHAGQAAFLRGVIRRR
ncbi:MAG TPA: DUF664 domain-containing protein, partial [Actinopolymorphaceae bacterium]